MNKFRFRPALEMLENREVPGSLLNLGQPDTSGLMLIAAAGQLRQHGGDDAEPIPIAATRVPIDLPPADAVIISKDKDGKTDPFLDLAHDVFPVGTPQDARSIQGVIDDITTEFNRGRKPVDIILVAADGGNAFIVGSSYLFKDGPATKQFVQDCCGMVDNLTIVGSDAQRKKDVLQQIADGLNDGNHPVKITAYQGPLAVVDAPAPALGHFVRQPGPVLHFTPR
jgi:hypothetical protein